MKKSIFLSSEIAQRPMPLQLEEVLHPLMSVRTYGAFAVDSSIYAIGTPQRLEEFENFVKAEQAAGRFHGQEPKGAL